MPHLWENREDTWEPALLAGSRDLLPGVRLCHAGQQSTGLPETWLLIAALNASSSVRVNGELLLIGARVLRNKDEITGFGRRFFFSTEKTAEFVRFDAALHGTAFCARCKKSMGDAEGAVACPSCGAWHHQSDAMPCWLYSGTCALCSQPTALNAGYQWTPDEEVWP